MRSASTYQIRVRDPDTNVVEEHGFQDFWLHQRNTIPLEDVGRECKELCVVLRICGVHAALIQPRSVLDFFLKGRCNALDCKIC